MTPKHTERTAHEIMQLPAGSAECISYVRAAQPPLSAEAAVHLVRQALARDDQLLLCAAAELLIGRDLHNGRFEGGHCEANIRALAQHFGIDNPDTLNEFRARCHESLWKSIVAGGVAKPFLEERFFLALKNIGMDVWRSMRRQDRGLVSLATEVEEAFALSDNQADVELQRLADVDGDVVLGAIRSLPRRLSEAAYLRYVVEMQVESKDPNEPTIAKIMNVSERMVRKYLADAASRLTTHPKVLAIRKDMSTYGDAKGGSSL